MDRSHYLLRKRLYDHGGSHSNGYARNFKCPKSEATSQLLRHCHPSLALPVREAVVALYPLRVTRAMSSGRRFNKPMASRSLGDSGEPVITLQNVRRRPSADLAKGCGDDAVVCDLSPPYGEKTNCDSPSEDDVVTHCNSTLEQQQPPIETVCKQDKISEDEIDEDLSEDEIDEDCAAPRFIHGLGIGSEEQAACVSSSKHEVEANGKSHLESNPPPEKALEVSDSLTARAMGAVFRGNRNYLLAKESNNQSVGPALVDLNRINVCKALKLFDDIYQKLLRQLEASPKSVRKKAGQIPIEAAMIAKQKLKWLNSNERIVGAVPGIEVGDQFRFRAQLALIGLHCHYFFGIDYMKKDGQIFATSIVDSDGYTHEKAPNQHAGESESPDVFTYSGQGGNPGVDHRHLGLKNSMEARTPIRVFRKRQTDRTISPTSAKSGKITSLLYDGLYAVSNCTQERGPHGKLILKFQFTRITGQPELNKSLVSMANKLQVHGDCNVVDDDISQGKEKIPIRALNALGDEKPPRFKYVTEMVCQKDLVIFASSCGCKCINGCSDLEPCSCLIKNGSEIPFNENGSILRAKPIIYECGPSCKCPPSCKNRVSQHGVQHPLEIFKTKSKGWGVRSQDFIPQGSFICEYAGELLSETEAEKRKDKDEYLFDIGSNYDHHDAAKATAHHQQSRNSKKRNDNCDFTVDAAEYGNVGRFLNHSCSPNVFAQDVLYDHDDKGRSHIMLFASKSIPPLRELTFDYNYKIDQVCDANGNIKRKDCCCGARKCNGRMY